MEINRIDLYASLCDHIACHRAVDAAGKKKHGLSVGADRHTTRPRDHQGKDIYLLADLHSQKHIRVVHVHAHLRKRLKNGLSHITVNLVGGHRITLVASSCHHLKGKVLIRVDLIHILYHMFFQVLIIPVVNLHHGADICDTEYPL